MRAARETTLVEQACALLDALFADLRGQAHARFGRGTSAQTFAWWPTRATPGLLPEPLLRELTYTVPDDVRLAPSTLDQLGARLLDTRCVWAEVALPTTFKKEKNRAPRAVVEPAARAACRERVDAFPLAPSLLVDSEWSWFVAWLLDAPARVDNPATLARVEAAQLALAERVGGRTCVVTEAVPGQSPGYLGGVRPDNSVRATSVPAWHPCRRVVRVPASRDHDEGGPGGGRVSLEFLDRSRSYGLDEIENALRGGKPARGGKK